MALYDNINPRTVKLWTLEILKWMVREEREYTVKEVSGRFKINIREAYIRVTRLRSWGMVNLKKRKRPRTYIVSPWGFKFLKDKESKQIEGDGPF